jgi:hypothetical protein
LGGFGSDVFIYNEGDGVDRVFAFKKEVDRIHLNLTVGTDVDSFAELQALITKDEIIVRTGAHGVSLAFDDGDKLSIRGMTSLSEGDWLFTA